jgi:maleylacetoacetate isomerase
MTPKSHTQDKITLHTYFRSSCSARVRIALTLKGLPYESIYVNILQGAHKQDPYKSLNPSESVPTLEISRAADTTTTATDTSTATAAPTVVKITQSVAALEYLDEAYPSTVQLLPPREQVEKRALVRTLVQIVAGDTQPVSNMRVLNRVKQLAGADEAGAAWAKEFMTAGLRAYENVLRSEGCAGRYSVGDQVTMADVCLVPAVWGAVRFGVDMGELAEVARVVRALEELMAVQVAHWKNQEDTPEGLRV